MTCIAEKLDHIFISFDYSNKLFCHHFSDICRDDVGKVAIALNLAILYGIEHPYNKDNGLVSLNPCGSMIYSLQHSRQFGDWSWPQITYACLTGWGGRSTSCCIVLDTSFISQMKCLRLMLLERALKNSVVL